MHLKKITLKDFLTYKDQEYNFKQTSVMIQGLNLTDDNQKSNGAGKTSLPTAVEFCLTGDNSRGVRDIELVRFGQKEAFLDLFVECPFRNEELHISWQIKKKGSNVLKLTLNKGKGFENVSFSNVNDGKKYILKWLAISKEDLFNLFLINKTRFTSFFNSTNKEKVELINRFRDTSIIEGIEEVDSTETELKHSIVKADILKIDGKVELLENDIDELENVDLEIEFENRLNEIRAENVELKLDIEEIEKEIAENEFNKGIKNAEIVKIESLNNLLKADSKNIDSKIDVIKETVSEINVQLNDAQKLVDKFEPTDFNSKKKVFKDQISEIELSITDKEKKRDENNAKEERILKALSKISVKLSGTITCPSCSHKFLTDSETPLEEIVSKENDFKGVLESCRKLKDKFEKDIEEIVFSKDVPKQHIKEIDLESEKEIEKKSVLLKAVSSVNELINAENKKLNSLKRDKQNKIDEINVNKNDISKKESYISSINNDIKNLNTEISDLRNDILRNNNLLTTLEKGDNLPQIKALKAKVRSLKKDRIKKEVEENAVSEELLKMAEWKKSFKLFKMHIAGKSLKLMEFHCNRFLEGLGSDLKVVFENYKVLAKGDIKNEITASVLRNTKRTFNSFSGGERCLLLFSSILANRHMINATHPYGGLNFLFIDEVFEGADGVVLKHIVLEAKKLQECIMIITHVTDEDVNEDILRIVKRNGISKIE